MEQRTQPVDQEKAQRERFGKFLPAERKRRYPNQDQVADVLGMSQSHVSKWERGEVVGFTAGDLRAWSDALELPMLRLLLAAGFLTDLDIAQVDPDLYINPYVRMLADDLPPLGSEQDVKLIAELAWVVKNFAIRHGAPPVERGAGQTTQLDTPVGAVQVAHAADDVLSDQTPLVAAPRLRHA
jgi:transcriptional regulator with XRE-family HTH domain